MRVSFTKCYFYKLFVNKSKKYKLHFLSFVKDLKRNKSNIWWRKAPSKTSLVVIIIIMVNNKMASTDIDPRQDSNQQPQSSRPFSQHQEAIDSLTQEAEQLKRKLEEERSKLCDVECKSFAFYIKYALIFFNKILFLKNSTYVFVSA